MRVVLALAAVAVLAAGCGGAKTAAPETNPAASVKQAAAKTEQANSQHVKLRASITVQGRTVAMKGDGDFDTAARTGEMTVDANIAGLSMEIDQVMKGTDIYMRSPLFAAALPKGKTWLKIDLQTFGESQGLDVGTLLAQNPTETFSQLRATGSVTKVGEDGDTTHYRGRIDPAKLPSAVRNQGIEYRPYHVWVGKDDGYIHRMRVDYSAAGQKVAMTMRFSDFGKTVDVTVPAASETMVATNGFDLGG
jgi:hypothetical protein